MFRFVYFLATRLEKCKLLLAAAGLVWLRPDFICFWPDFNINSYLISTFGFRSLNYLSCEHQLSSFPANFRKSSTPATQDTAFPIRSCFKIDDELVSNFEPPLRKTVTFSGYTRVFPVFTPLEQSPLTFTTQLVKVQHQPKKSPFKYPYTQRKGLRVRFFPFCTSIEPNGRFYMSLTTLQEESEYWKPEAMDNEPLYTKTFQRK